MSDPERDLKLRQLAANISDTCNGVPLDIAIGAAALFIACLVDLHDELPQFATMAAQKLREVADLIDPQP